MLEVCSNCGAALTTEPTPSVLGGFDIDCAFCGHRHHVPPAPAPRAPPDPRPTTTPRGSYRWIAGIIAAIAVVAAIPMLTLFAQSHDTAPFDALNVATIGGKEAVVTSLRTIGTNDEMFVAAYDSTTLDRRWKAGPFGHFNDNGGYRYVAHVVAGSRVVVTDVAAKVHILDLQDGKEQRVIALTDKVEDGLCAVDDSHVWLAQLDKKSVLVDILSGSVTEAARPKVCDAAANRTAAPAKWKIQSFTASDPTPFDATSTRVLVGTKTPGTPTPIVVGIDPKDDSVRWQVPLAAVDPATVRPDSSGRHLAALCGDRFVATYGVGANGRHATALDARDGKRLWDVVLPQAIMPTGGRVICSPTRAYVLEDSMFDVLDANSGKVIGSVP